MFPAGEKRIKFKQVRIRFSAFMVVVCLGGFLHSDCFGWVALAAAQKGRKLVRQNRDG